MKQGTHEPEYSEKQSADQVLRLRVRGGLKRRLARLADRQHSTISAVAKAAILGHIEKEEGRLGLAVLAQELEVAE